MDRNLIGLRLALARGGWTTLTLLNLVMLVISAPIEHQARISEGVRQFSDALSSLDISLSFYAGFRTFLDLSLAGIFFAIAVLIFLNKPSSRIVILTSIAIQTFGVLFVPTYHFLETAQPGWTLPVSLVRAVGLASSLVVFFYLVPDGRYIPGWTRWAAYAWLGVVGIWLFVPSAPANLIHMSTWSNSLPIALVLFASAYGSGIAAQVYRYQRASESAQKQQSKWLVFALAMGFAGFILYHLPLVILPERFGQPGVDRLRQILFGIPLYHLFILSIPICISIAISRHRLWDIDRLINRTLTASFLTAVLTLVYIASVLLLSQAFVRITGSARSTIPIALSTVVIALLFLPVRRKIQQFIDRRFFRQRYDLEKALTALTISLREEVDLDMLLKGIISLLRHTLQPSSISFWLTREPKGKNSTASPASRQACVDGWIEPSDPIIAYFMSNPNITETASLTLQSKTVSALGLVNESICVPLIGQGQFIGLIHLGRSLSDRPYTNDDYNLLTMLASQAAPVLKVAQMVRRQQLEIVEQERVEYEMSIARKIQQSFLPKQLPLLPNWQIAAHYQPAHDVGGDFYDLFTFPDGKVAVTIGDVSGHGVPAALMMVNVRSTLRDAARRFDTPSGILSHANSQLYHEMPPSMFITCLCMVLDAEHGQVTLANAGHNLPIRLCDSQSDEIWAAGLPLGIMENALYEEKLTAIQPGEFLLLFSDGLVEARSPEREMFGEHRVKEVIANHDSSVGGIIHDLLAAMNVHIGENGEQEDDVTIVGLYHLPNQA